MREILRLVPRLRKRMSEWTPSEDTMGATSYPNAPASCSYTQVHERQQTRSARGIGYWRSPAQRPYADSLPLWTPEEQVTTHTSVTQAHT